MQIKLILLFFVSVIFYSSSVFAEITSWTEYAPLVVGNSTAHETPVSVIPATSGPVAIAQTAAEGLIYYQKTANQWNKGSLAGKIIGSAGFDAVGDDIYLAHRGMDSAVYAKKRIAGVWSNDWEPWGGLIVASPKIIKTSAGIDVITVGSDNRLWVKHQNNDETMGDWQLAADIKIKGEIAAARVQDTVVVALRGEDDVLWAVEKNAGGNWQLQATAGRVLAGSQNSIALYSDGVTAYYAHIGTDKAIWYKTRVNGAWNNWQSLSGDFIGNVAMAGSNGDVMISVQDSTGNVSTRVLLNGSWRGWQVIDGALAADHSVAGADGKFVFVIRRPGANDLYGTTFSPRCSPNAVSGCSVCNGEGLAWVDTNARCGAGQFCSRGQCVALAEAIDFNLSTEDTKITLVVVSNKLFLKELANPAAGWNWAKDMTELPLMKKATVGGVVYNSINWVYDSATTDTSNGTKITLKFVSSNPNLELRSEWWARPGKGPIRHVDYLVNKTGKTATISNNPTFDVVLRGFDSGAQKITLWSFNDDGGSPDPAGIYKESIISNFNKSLPYTQYQGWAPYIILDKSGSGVYFGSEWSYGAINVAGVISASGAVGARVTMEDKSGGNFKTDIFVNETFIFPPGFVGAYSGDADDAGNGLKKYLFNYSVPEVLKNDTSFPKVQWNSIGAIGWVPVESKFKPLVDAVASLGFEEMMIDIGWWANYPVSTPNPPLTNLTNWPSGMKAARDYALRNGMRFGVYDNSSYKSAIASEISKKKATIKYLFDQYKADVWRSDSTGGDVIAMSYGGASRAHYVQDQEYWATKGFYQMLDDLHSEYGDVFQWENCASGGQLKDFGTMKRATKISNTDTYTSAHNRIAFYDASYYLPPMQLHAALGPINFDNYPAELRLNHAEGLLFQFRSASMGSPQIFLDSPNPTEGGKVWTRMEKDQITKAVATYKTKIRPLIREGNLYHILPRPDGTNWDGIEYYNPDTKKGVAYLFKPSASAANTKNIKLDGLNPSEKYNITFEDGSNPAIAKTGAELMNSGINITLTGTYNSELVFFEVASATCANGCTVGTKQCTGNGYQLCADSNGDGCLEWGATTICASGKTCGNGVCLSSDGGNDNTGNTNPPVIEPVIKMTRAEIIAKINEIVALIAKLQAQLKAMTGGSVYSCSQITKILRYGIQNDPEVKCLQEVLKVQGYTVTVSGNYDLATKNAVAKFQQQYAKEILAPYGLRYGSGNVGNATMGKVNSFIK